MARRKRILTAKVEYHGNRNVATIHTNKQFTKPGDDINSLWVADHSRLLPVQSKIALMDGVQAVTVCEYYIRITKAEVFNWEDILKDAFLEFRRHYGIRDRFERLADIPPPKEQW